MAYKYRALGVDKKIKTGDRIVETLTGTWLCTYAPGYRSESKVIPETIVEPDQSKHWSARKAEKGWAVIRPDGSIRCVRKTKADAWKQAADEELEMAGRGSPPAPVRCLNDGQEFVSSSSAGEYYGVPGKRVAHSTNTDSIVKGLRFVKI